MPSSARFATLDAFVNAAGVAKPEREYEEDDVLDVIDVNLNSVMRLSMASRPLLAKSKGAIVNVASMLSYWSTTPCRPIPPANRAFSG